MPDFSTPDTRFLIVLPYGDHHPGTIFLSAVIDYPRLQVGDYSHASAFDPPEDCVVGLAN